MIVLQSVPISLISVSFSDAHLLVDSVLKLEEIYSEMIQSLSCLSNFLIVSTFLLLGQLAEL